MREHGKRDGRSRSRCGQAVGWALRVAGGLVARTGEEVERRVVLGSGGLGGGAVLEQQRRALDLALERRAVQRRESPHVGRVHRRSRREQLGGDMDVPRERRDVQRRVVHQVAAAHGVRISGEQRRHLGDAAAVRSLVQLALPAATRRVRRRLRALVQRRQLEAARCALQQAVAQQAKPRRLLGDALRVELGHEVGRLERKQVAASRLHGVPARGAVEAQHARVAAVVDRLGHEASDHDLVAGGVLLHVDD